MNLGGGSLFFRLFNSKQRMRWYHTLALPFSIAGVALGLNIDRQPCAIAEYFEQKKRADAVVKQFMVLLLYTSGNN